MPEETMRELFDRIEREGKEICDFQRYYIGGGEDLIIIKTCKAGER